MHRHRYLILPVLFATFALAACGDSKKDEETAATPAAETATAAPTEAPADTATPAPAAAGEKPVVKVPKGDPPTKLVVKDLKEGTGEVAKPGQSATVQYVGVSYSTGKQFDASWDRGEPFTFGLGQGQVISGWDQGVAGMKVGGRRMLIIPPDLGYGEAGAGADIGPNETLIFVVDLVGLQ